MPVIYYVRNEKSSLKKKGFAAVLKDIMINLLIAGGIWKAHDLLTKPKPKRLPPRRTAEADLEPCLTGCAVFVGIIFAFFMLCVIYMAVTDLPCFR